MAIRPSPAGDFKMSYIASVQSILFRALRRCARIVPPNMEGLSILSVCAGEALAAIAVELIVNGKTIDRADFDVEATIKAVTGPIEKWMRENIAEHLAKRGRYG
jgi:hypothetical protein